MGWKEQTLELFEIFGPASLAVVSFTEAIIQPVPPDLLYMPMLVNAIGDTPLVVWLWLVVTVSSVLGSLVGYTWMYSTIQYCTVHSTMHKYPGFMSTAYVCGAAQAEHVEENRGVKND